MNRYCLFQAMGLIFFFALEFFPVDFEVRNVIRIFLFQYVKNYELVKGDWDGRIIHSS